MIISFANPTQAAFTNDPLAHQSVRSFSVAEVELRISMWSSNPSIAKCFWPHSNTKSNTTSEPEVLNLSTGHVLVYFKRGELLIITLLVLADQEH